MDVLVRSFRALALLLLVTAALRVPFLSLPLERDEGEYAYIAWRLDSGELPYRDWVDQKPPGIFWMYRLALNLPFQPTTSIHLMGLLAAFVSTAGLWLLARHFLDGFWALGAAVLYAAMCADPWAQGTAANTELFMVPCLIWSIVTLVRAVGRSKCAAGFMVLTGILVGMGAAFKQVGALHWLFLLALPPFLAAPEDRRRDWTRFVSWSAAGVIAVWGLIGLYFLAKGALGAMVHDVLLHNLAYVQGLPGSIRVQLLIGALERLSRSESVIWMLVVAGWLALWRARREPFSILMAGWLLTSGVGVAASGYFFPHYFQQLFPVLALGAAFGAQSLGQAPFWRDLALVKRRTLLLLALAMLPALTFGRFIFGSAPDQRVRSIYPKSSFAEMPGLGQRLAAVTRPDDRVFVFGAEPELLFYAHRVSASRYIFLNPLYGPYKDAAAEQAKTAEEVARARPAALVYFQRGLIMLPNSERHLTQWTRAYLQEGFVPDTCVVAEDPAAGGLLNIIASQPPVLAPGQEIVATLFVRARR